MGYSFRKLSATVPFVFAILSASFASAAEQRYLVERIPGTIDGQSLGMLLDATDDGIVSFSSRNNSGQEGSVILDLRDHSLSSFIHAANLRVGSRTIVQDGMGTVTDLSTGLSLVGPGFSSLDFVLLDGAALPGSPKDISRAMSVGYRYIPSFYRYQAFFSVVVDGALQAQPLRYDAGSPADAMLAKRVNKRGQIVGNTEPFDGYASVVYWPSRSSDMIWTDYSDHYVDILDLNERGEFVGGGSLNGAFIGRIGGRIRRLPSPADSGGCYARGINDSGTIVGSCSRMAGLVQWNRAADGFASVRLVSNDGCEYQAASTGAPLFLLSDGSMVLAGGASPRPGCDAENQSGTLIARPID